jgi:hypothetical protein
MIAIALPPILFMSRFPLRVEVLGSLRLEDVLHGMVILFASLIFYSFFVFPQLAAKYGGGMRPVVLVYLSEESSVPFAKYGIGESSDHKIVGPAFLILKTDDAYVISGLQSRRTGLHLFGAFFRAGFGGLVFSDLVPSVSLNKEMISSIVYDSDFPRSDSRSAPEPGALPSPNVPSVHATQSVPRVQ